MPYEVEFAIKTVLAQAMLARALDAGVSTVWVTVDETYGKDPSSVPGSRTDILRCAGVRGRLKRRSCCDGAKGPDKAWAPD